MGRQRLSPQLATVAVLCAAIALGTSPACSDSPQPGPQPDLQDVVEDVAMDLESDDEAKRFVEGFWKANDPIPHTPENEFKQDVFSRVEYANTYFKETRVGWKTDRGRIWIIWGEPDEVMRDEKPLHPTERWVYFRMYKDISPIVFIFEQYVSDYRQVFSNVPGEFGHRPSRPD